MASKASEPDADDWKRESDHRTLSEAETIKQDPLRMKGVAKHHKKMTRALSGVGRVLGKR